MSCYHPLRAFPIGLTKDGKKQMKIVGYNINHLEISLDNKIKAYEDNKTHTNYYRRIDQSESVVIPCGQCLGCRLDYSREWANRCMLELQQHEHAYFLTLTYNDEHVPVSCYEDEDGNCLPSLSLCKHDFQLFMKRWRKYFDAIQSDRPTRYFASLEYGSNSFRPHYHAIIFGPEISDLQEFSRSALGHVYYCSPTVERLWSVKSAKWSYEYEKWSTTPLSSSQFGDNFTCSGRKHRYFASKSSLGGHLVDTAFDLQIFPTCNLLRPNGFRAFSGRHLVDTEYFLSLSKWGPRPAAILPCPSLRLMLK